MRFLLYKQWFAHRLASDLFSKNLSVISCKRKLFKGIHGKILELGPGTGSNFRFFPKTIDWYGLEPNQFMEPYLTNEAKKYMIQSVHLINGKAERIPFPDKTFDAIVSTHVLCSVDDPKKVLREIYRVLKNRGTVYVLEHVQSSHILQRFIQRIISPLWVVLADGCHPNRNIERDIKNIFLNHKLIDSVQFNIPIISPHIVGKVIKE